jgi:hypothetical protein
MRFGVEYMPGLNVGDGIYQLSVLGLLAEAFPAAELVRVDGPYAKTFGHRPRAAARARLGSRSLDVTPYCDVDCMCLSGPILGTDFARVYGPTIRAVRDHGGAYLILSAHCPGYSAEVIDFLTEAPPLGITTRDRPSFEALRSCGAPLYDGVCASFLVSQTCRTVSLREPLIPFITVTCDKGAEPKISFVGDNTGRIDLNTIVVADYEAKQSWKYLRHVDFLRSSETTAGVHRIIRPLHDIGYKFSHLNYARPNSFLSYLPESYLALYRATQLTVSDRVHSCAPTLAYGNPAVFLGKTPRAAIFDRIGVMREASGAMTLDPATVAAEHQAVLEWLRSVL